MANERNVQELIQNARHKSVNEKRLTKLKGGIATRYLYDKPLIEYLKENEQPHYILAHMQKAPKFSGPNPPSWSEKNLSGMAMHMITDERWLIVVGMESVNLGLDLDNKVLEEKGFNTGDKTFEVLLEEIIVTDYSTGTWGHKINIESPDYSIEVPIGNMYKSDEIESVVEFLKEKSKRNSVDDKEKTKHDTNNKMPKKANNKTTKNKNQYPVKIIDYSKTSLESRLYAKLIVPTKSSGAKFTSQGWSIGGNIIRRNSSKGEIEDKAWENYVKKLILYDDRIEIGITYGDMTISSDNSINQNMRLSLSEISNIRTQRIEASPGFTFETAGDVYQFKLGRKGMGVKAKDSDAIKAVQQIKQAVRAAPEKEPTPSGEENSGGSSDSDPMEKLSQLKELHDSDVLTDEEFQKKKEELLDQI